MPAPAVPLVILLTATHMMPGAMARMRCDWGAHLTAGKFGQAIALNGSTDYLQLSPRLADTTGLEFRRLGLLERRRELATHFRLRADTGHYLFLTPRSGGGGTCASPSTAAAASTTETRRH